MSLKHIVSFETAKKLHSVGFKNENPKFGEVFYTIHPDTKQVDTVVVGSAKWHISALLEMYFAASATDLLQRMGENYRLLCVGGKDWIVEKEINTRFDNVEYEYITESFPLENNANPAEALASVFISNFG
jgi:hypothetical protein